MMTGKEIRQRFLEYFEKNGHKIVHSSPLLPANDPTLLFVNAGMNQFKDVFTGMEKRDYTRATTSQKCIRAGGKHNDLDEVGKTARHHTFFEMLGNFSFGDYFKKDAIQFAWDFLVNELKLNPNRLWFSYFGGDEEVPTDIEARDLWIEVGAAPERVLPFGRKDNFWQMGDTGPCGPCSEIHYYMGDEPNDPEKNHAKYVNGEGDTTIEIWNLVFMQFERNEVEKGVFELTPLPAPSVDTGAGLERVAAVLQGKTNNYDTDLLLPIIEFAAELAKKEYLYETQEGFAMRVVADHARSTTFAISDGILPGNEGRNYVLRKIMRRAIYHGREHLGFDGLFFYKVCGKVIDEMNDAYPELEIQRDFIEKMVRLEEERFGTTMTVGLKKLDELLSDKSRINFTDLAKLYDTFGLPIDLIFVVLNTTPPKDGANHWIFIELIGEPNTDSFEHNFFKFGDSTHYDYGENGLIEKTFEESIQPTHIQYTEIITGIDESEFRRLFEEAQKRLQANSEIGKTKQSEKINPIYVALERTSVNSTFRGYETIEVENAKVIALVKDDKQVNELMSGDEGLIILNETPFYAESGGQVGDTGNFFNSEANVKVLDTFAPIAGIVLHKSKIEKGSIKVGDEVTATVDVAKRVAV